MEDGEKQSRRRSLFDEFSRRTRLKPALLVMLPIIGAVAAIGLSYSVVMSAIAAPLTYAGATFLLAQFGRDSGTRKQPRLFELWGGKPSTAMLRHSDRRLNPITKERYCAKASMLIRRPMPTADQERADAASADSLYEAYGDMLRELTRDTKEYPLIFQELINYDFRRNLWAMKPIGILIVVSSITIQMGTASLALLGRAQRPGATDMAFLIVDVLILGCWLFLITPDWVRIAADAYAERLLAASDKV